MNYFKLPLINPFKFVPATNAPGIHFDDDWTCKQIKDFERRAYYKQKWQRADTTTLYCESTIAPQDLQVLRPDKTIAKTITWTPVHTATDYVIYKLAFTIADLPEGVYVLYQVTTLLGVSFRAISEPIDSRNVWPNTLLFNYKNSFNDFDVAFTLGIDFNFRCEAGIMDYTPERDRTDYIDQTANIETLSGIPSRSFKLYIGEAPGVAPWVIDLMNRIFVCDYINIKGKLYQSTDGSKWEVTRIKGYPLIAAAIDIAPQYNDYSLDFADGTGFIHGVVLAYDIETSFFGAATVVPIVDVENQY